MNWINGYPDLNDLCGHFIQIHFGCVFLDFFIFLISKS